MTAACRITIEDVSKLSPAAQRALNTARVEVPKVEPKPDLKAEATLEEVIRKLPQVHRCNLKHVVRAIDFILKVQADQDDRRKGSA